MSFPSGVTIGLVGGFWRSERAEVFMNSIRLDLSDPSLTTYGGISLVDPFESRLIGSTFRLILAILRERCVSKIRSSVIQCIDMFDMVYLHPTLRIHYFAVHKYGFLSPAMTAGDAHISDCIKPTTRGHVSVPSMLRNTFVVHLVNKCKKAFCKDNRAIIGRGTGFLRNQVHGCALHGAIQLVPFYRRIK